MSTLLSPLPRLVAQSGHSLGIGRETTAIALHFLHRAQAPPSTTTTTTSASTLTLTSTSTSTSTSAGLSPSFMNSDLLAMAVILLACKVAETEQSLRDVMNVVEYEAVKITEEAEAAGGGGGGGAAVIQIHRVIRMPEVLDQSYHALKEKVISAEFTLLDALDFNIEPPSSYEHLLLICSRLGLSREAKQVAWVVLSDAYMYACCLESDITLAASAVIVAVMLVGQGRGEVGDAMVCQEQCWTDFGVELADIGRVCQEMLRMYEEGCRE